MKNKIKKIINLIIKFFLIFVPSKYLRAKLKADWTKFYIKKYVKIAVENYAGFDKAPPFEKTPPVFQYWEQGIENAPPVIKKCVQSFDKFADDNKHFIIDFKTIENYIEVPSFIYDLKKEGKIKPAQFSDILRSLLLAYRPCIWADSSILLTDVLPKYVTENDFFMYKGIKKTPEQFAGANYFIYSKTPNRLLVELKDSILNYWKDNDFLVSYFTHPHYISLLTPYNKDLWKKIPVYDEDLTLQLSKVLFTDFNAETFEKIKKSCPVHKLTYKMPKKMNGGGLDKTFYAKILENDNA